MYFIFASTSLRRGKKFKFVWKGTDGTDTGQTRDRKKRIKPIVYYILYWYTYTYTIYAKIILPPT